MGALMLGLPNTHSPSLYRIPGWLRSPSVVLGVLFLICCLTGAGGLLMQRSLAAQTTPEKPSAQSRGAFETERFVPSNIRPIAPGDAKSVNEQLPVASLDNPAASPFRGSYAAAMDRTQSLDCLATAIYYEAAVESDDGQRAVAQVVLNRVAHVAYPNSVCGVVYQGSQRSTGCQFSFTCDGSLARRPSTSGWARARRVAEAALAGSVFGPVGRSTHYHADYVVPYWSSSLLKTAVIGAHIFYRSPGAAGRASAFTERYAGIEPDIAEWQARAAPETGTLALASPAEEPMPINIPEERAQELDRFALLDYDKSPAPGAAVQPREDPALEAALGAALGSARAKSRKPASLALAPLNR